MDEGETAPDSTPSWFISNRSSLPAEEPSRTETDRAPPLGQVTHCSITGSDRRAANSSLGPYSQPGRLKHTSYNNQKAETEGSGHEMVG